jgi:hypothetical protein
MITKEEAIRRWEVQHAFENSIRIQYRKLKTEIWKEAYWSDWEWDKYEYRIKPADLEVEIPLMCVMDAVGIIHWINADATIPGNWRKVKRFVTRNKVRHAVV